MYGYVLPEGKDSALNRLGMDFVVFSHHADRLVRYSWDTPQMWISDLTLENEFEISDDTFGSCPTYGYWSSDDLHLICDAEDRSQAGLIYHLRENSWESWPFACDRLAMSPKTGRLATWCLEVGRSNSYSVIEWGGEIWKTDQPPTTIMAHDPSGRRSMDELWSWSADGEKVAYYDSKGSLIIANAEGVALHAFTGSGIESFDYMLWQDSSIEWSADGTRLLVFAKGSADQPCPVGAAQDSGEAFCWQVLDAQSGEVVWHASELSNQFSKLRERHYDGASISSDGHYLALTSIQDNERDLFGFDIQSKEENQFFLWNIYADYMRWGSVQSSP